MIFVPDFTAKPPFPLPDPKEVEDNDQYFPPFHEYYIGNTRILELDDLDVEIAAEFISIFQLSAFRKYLSEYLGDPVGILKELTNNQFTVNNGFAKKDTKNNCLVKIDLPEDFSTMVYQKTVKIGDPLLFLYIFYSYITTKGFCYYPLWGNLKGDARENFLVHDLQDIILYREQADYIGKFMLYIRRKYLNTEKMKKL